MAPPSELQFRRIPEVRGEKSNKQEPGFYRVREEQAREMMMGWGTQVHKAMSMVRMEIGTEEYYCRQRMRIEDGRNMQDRIWEETVERLWGEDDVSGVGDGGEEQEEHVSPE